MNQVGTFHVAVSVLIERDGKILLCRRSMNREHGANEWEASLTGRVDQGETLETAALREAKEETRLDVELVMPFDTFHFYRGADRIEHLGICFWAKGSTGDVVIDPYEHSEFRWALPDEALKLIDNPSVAQALRSYIQLRQKIVD